METPMQELKEKLKQKQAMFKQDNKHTQTIKAIYENVIMLIDNQMIEKEKAVIIEANKQGFKDASIYYSEVAEQYYKETFNQ